LHYEHFDDDTDYKDGKVLEWNVNRTIKPIKMKINTKVESFRGTVPRGMTLDTRTGVISGAPTEIKNDVTEYNIIAHNHYGASEFRWRVVVADKRPRFLGTPAAVASNEPYTEVEKHFRYYLDAEHKPLDLKEYLNAGDKDLKYLPNQVTWQVAEGHPPLPPGMHLDYNHGRLIGTPHSNGNRKLMIQAWNNGSTRSGLLCIHIDVVDRKPEFIAYTQMEATYCVYTEIPPNRPIMQGGDVKHHDAGFTIYPKLPPGLLINSKTGEIHGKPQCMIESKEYTVTAKNEGGSHEISVRFSVGDRPPLITGYDCYPRYTVGLPIKPNVPTNQKYVPHTNERGCVHAEEVIFSTESGEMPEGFHIDKKTGVITGTPTATATYMLTVVAKCGGGECLIHLSMTVTPVPPEILSYSHEKGKVSKVLEFDLNVEARKKKRKSGQRRLSMGMFSTGGTAGPNDEPPITRPILVDGTGPIDTCSFSCSGTLPPGLDFNTINGEVSGSLEDMHSTLEQTLTYEIFASNGGGRCKKPYTLTIRILPKAKREHPPSIISYSQQVARYKHNEEIDINVPNFQGVVERFYTTDVKGVEKPLPAGLVIDEKLGEISGSPSELYAESEYVVYAENNGGKASIHLRIAVVESAPSGIAYPRGLRYNVDSQELIDHGEHDHGKPIMPIFADASSGGVDQYTGYLPEGLEVDERTGEIRGCPQIATKPETQQYRVVAANKEGQYSIFVEITSHSSHDDNDSGAGGTNVHDYNIYILGARKTGKETLVSRFHEHPTQLTGSDTLKQIENKYDSHADGGFESGGGRFQNPDGTGSDLYAHLFTVPSPRYHMHHDDALVHEIITMDGRSKRHSVSKAAKAGVHGMLLVFDVTDAGSFMELTRAIQLVHRIEQLQGRRIPTMLVANKVDLLDHEMWSPYKMALTISQLQGLPPGCNPRLKVYWDGELVFFSQPGALIEQEFNGKSNQQSGVSVKSESTWVPTPKAGKKLHFEIALPQRWNKQDTGERYRLRFEVHQDIENPQEENLLAEKHIEGGHGFFDYHEGKHRVNATLMHPERTTDPVGKMDFQCVVSKMDVVDRHQVQTFRQEHALMHTKVSALKNDQTAKVAGCQTVYQVFHTLVYKIHNQIDDIDERSTRTNPSGIGVNGSALDINGEMLVAGSFSPHVSQRGGGGGGVGETGWPGTPGMNVGDGYGADPALQNACLPSPAEAIKKAWLARNAPPPGSQKKKRKGFMNKISRMGSWMQPSAAAAQPASQPAQSPAAKTSMRGGGGTPVSMGAIAGGTPVRSGPKPSFDPRGAAVGAKWANALGPDAAARRAAAEARLRKEAEAEAKARARGTMEKDAMGMGMMSGVRMSPNQEPERERSQPPSAPRSQAPRSEPRSAARVLGAVDTDSPFSTSSPNPKWANAVHVREQQMQQHVANQQTEQDRIQELQALQKKKEQQEMKRGGSHRWY
jgi:GTPase SAR1 family protein